MAKWSPSRGVSGVVEQQKGAETESVGLSDSPGSPVI